MADKIEPRGFFTAKTAFWSLKREMEGTFQQGLYLAYMQIEWMESNTEKLEFAKAILAKYPNYAPAWKVIAVKGDDSTERLHAIEKGLDEDPDAETKGMLLINRALVWDNQDKSEEAKKLLGEMVFDPETTVSKIEMAKFVLSSIAQREN